MSGADDAESIDRPRFLGLGEFGPRNIIYHEGRRHRIAGLVVPAGGIEGRLMRAKLCRTCGYLHDGDHFNTDVCDGCSSNLKDGGGQPELRLLD